MKLIAFICPLLLIIEINAFAQIQKQEQTIYEPTVAELTKRLKQTRKEVIEIHAEAIKIAEEVIKIEEENKKLIDKNKILAGQAKAEKAKNQLYLASLREANAKIKELEAVNNALRAKINTLTDKATAITERAVLIESRYKEKQFADSLRISTLETNASRLNETIEDLSRQVNDLYKTFDRIGFKVNGYQRDRRLNRSIVNAGLELNERNTYEVNPNLLVRITIETEDLFNITLPKKALKYKLVYRNGPKEENIRTDEKLESGINNINIMTSKNFKFEDYRGGHFELTVYYEENLQPKDYIKRIFSFD